jgi:hypothetical protein
MKRILCTVAILMVASMAFAGTASDTSSMTPQQAMAAMANCPVCSVWMTDPALGPNLRHNVFATKDGYVETLMDSDPSTMASFNKCAAECEKRAASVPSMSAEQKAKLCPLCQGHMAFMGVKGVSVENFNADLGLITVGSATTPEGVKAMHEYVTKSHNFGELLSKAEMGAEPMKSKM